MKKSGSREHGRQKTKVIGEHGKYIAREEAKYDLGSQEQRGNFRTGAGSMGPSLQGLITISSLKKSVSILGAKCQIWLRARGHS